MTKQQIKDYLNKYRIDSEEQLTKHIEQLKVNTKPNNELIFVLVNLLVNEKSVLLSFFAENKKQEMFTRTITPFFLDEAIFDYQSLEGGKIKDNEVTYNSTRHKSKNSEIHKELTTEEKLKIAEGFRKEAKKQLNITLEDVKAQASQSYYTSPKKKEEIKNEYLERLAKISAEKTEKIRANFYKYLGANPILWVKEFNNLQEAKECFKNSDWEEVFYYIIGTLELLCKESKVAEKENKQQSSKKEENLVFPKGSAIHKDDVITNTSKGEKETMEYLNEELPPYQPLDFSLLLTDWFDRMSGTKDRPTTFTVGEGVKESNGKTDYSHLELDISDNYLEKTLSELPISEDEVRVLHKGIKESDGKTDYGELDWDYIDLMAFRMSKNLEKYPPKNWQKKLEIKELAKSAIRHARKILQKIDNDEETLQEHATALGCNGMIINFQLKNNL